VFMLVSVFMSVSQLHKFCVYVCESSVCSCQCLGCISSVSMCVCEREFSVFMLVSVFMSVSQLHKFCVYVCESSVCSCQCLSCITSVSMSVSDIDIEYRLFYRSLLQKRPIILSNSVA